MGKKQKILIYKKLDGNLHVEDCCNVLSNIVNMSIMTKLIVVNNLIFTFANFLQQYIHPNFL